MAVKHYRRYNQISLRVCPIGDTLQRAAKQWSVPSWDGTKTVLNTTRPSSKACLHEEGRY